MSALGQGNEIRFTFEVSGIEMQVVDFTAREEISAPYEVDLSLASEDEIAFDDVIGRPALLTLLGDEDRNFHGIITQFVQAGSRGRFNLYRARMAPSIWLLSLKQNSRIFQDMSTQDIVTRVLEDGGITSDHFEFRLQRQYASREYCVQYRETDLNFLSRLLEEEGIFYFFEHTEENHLLVFGDSSTSRQPIPGEAEVLYHVPDTRVPEEEAVDRFDLSRQIQSGKITLKDYTFTRPSLDLTASQESNGFSHLEVYEYPGRYADQHVGRNLAQIRLQEAMVFIEKAEGRSTCSRFMPGFVFELIDHDREAFNQEYLLVHVSHSGSQPQVLEEDADGAECSYTNEFFCIPSSVDFRPRRGARKPVVEGVQTAMVVGPEGEEIYTDEHGRVKVQFHWDREGQRNERSSCWIRVSQVWAGAGWGALFIPRIDQEVIVDFEEGDPDRPIITGRVYHGANTPPYALPEEKTKSTIQSESSPGGGGANEFRFEDKSGEEEIYLHGQKDWTIAIEHDKEQSIGNDETSEVGNNRTRSVGEDEEVTVGNNRTVTIGNDESVTIGNNRTVDVGADENITIGGNRTEDVGTDQTITVGGNCTLNASGNVTITGEGNVELNGQRITITGQSEVSISVGGSTIRVSHSGIEISGPRISTNAQAVNEISGQLVTIN